MNAKQLHSWVKDIPKTDKVSRPSLIAMLRQASCLATDLEAENRRLKEDYKQVSEIADEIITNEQCKSCDSNGMFPSIVCCECVLDSFCKLATLMDEKVVEQGNLE